MTAYRRALESAHDWLLSEEATDFAKNFGSPYYEWDEAHGLCYRVGSALVTIDRGPNGESVTDVENKTHYFRSGDTPGQPSQYDDFDEGIEGAERSAAATPMYCPQHVTAQQKALHNRVAGVLDAIKEKYASLLIARYFEGKTEAQIAGRLGITQQAVSARLRTAHRAFADEMASGELVAA